MARNFDVPPLPEFRFGVASVVPAEFLNQLDDMLYLYGDSVLPTHTGTQVFIQATAGDEAQLAIDRRYFIQATSIYEPVVGAAGLYDLYAVASYVPTSHATTVKSFDVVVGTEPPSTFEYTRHLAKVVFDGALITDVLQDPHKLNAAQLDGHIASRDPADGDVVPVASSNGKLHKRFKPRFPGVDVDMGDVIDYFIPPGMPRVAPVLFEFCEGQVLGPGQQDVVPGGTIQVPNLVDKFIVAANPFAGPGVGSLPDNNPAAGPGIGGGKAAHFGGVADHTHPLAEHTHGYDHQHDAGHLHFVDDHTHPLNRAQVLHGVYADPPWGSRKRRIAPATATTPAVFADYNPPLDVPAADEDTRKERVERGEYQPDPNDAKGIFDPPNIPYARGADVIFDANSSGVDNHNAPTNPTKDTAVTTPKTNVNSQLLTPGTDALTSGGAQSVAQVPAHWRLTRIMRVRD